MLHLLMQKYKNIRCLRRRSMGERDSQMKNFMRSLYNVFNTTNSSKVQVELARQLHSTEYKHETFDYILSMVRAGKVHEISSKDCV